MSVRLNWFSRIRSFHKYRKVHGSLIGVVIKTAMIWNHFQNATYLTDEKITNEIYPYYLALII